MDTGSNKSLFTMIAVVIFGIFLSLSYWMFQDEMKNVLASVLDGVEDVTGLKLDNSLAGNGNGNLGGSSDTELPTLPEEPEVVLVPNAESDFVFDSVTGTITSYKGTRKDVVIPKLIKNVSVKILGTDVFYQKGLTSVYIPEGVTTIGFRAFSTNLLTNVEIPSSVKIISGGAFSKNNLTNVYIPNTVTSIQTQAFAANPITSAHVATITSLLSDVFPSTAVITRY